MQILGISSFSHESSAALLRKGVLIAHAEEERFNREKHTARFPRNAIEFCLRHGGSSFHDIDHVAFFWQPLREIWGNALHMARYFPSSLALLRAPSGGADPALTRLGNMWQLDRFLREEIGGPVPRIHYVEHHLAHAASCFYPSGWNDAAILTIDGRGECTSTLFAVGEGKHIRKLQEFQVPHSLGHLYAAVTDHLGFTPFHDEWKVMGMAAYGKPTLLPAFQSVLKLLPDGGYRLNLDFFAFHVKGSAQWLNPKFATIFGRRRGPREEIIQAHCDLAYALQKTVENAGVQLAKALRERSGKRRLCLTGGVTLNCLMNERIVAEAGFDEVFIQPIANDAGTSLGAALYVQHEILGHEPAFKFRHSYWGPEFTQAEMESALKAKGVNYVRSEDIARDTAREVAQGKIVGWFQGRMESGPRALGNRSIVVDPTLPGMKDRLNARVKKRESYRPFAPSVLEEKVHEYFEMPRKQLSPYMILTGRVRPEQANRLPAVTHADGSARVHTVNRNVNERYWRLIQEFEKIRGVPVLLNTSFNENEPIVCTPEDAVNCFLRTDFDVLALGDFLAVKG